MKLLMHGAVTDEFPYCQYGKNARDCCGAVATAKVIWKDKNAAGKTVATLLCSDHLHQAAELLPRAIRQIIEPEEP